MQNPGSQIHAALNVPAPGATKSIQKRVIGIPALMSAALGLCLLTTAAAATEQPRAHKHRAGNLATSYTEYADVIDVRPIYRQVRVEKPVRECWTDHQQHQTVYEGYNRRPAHNTESRRSYNGNGNPVLGGIIGGAIGNQIGRRAGSDQARLGATIAGAVIGSAIANNTSSRDRRDRRSHRDRRNNHRDHRRHNPGRIETRPIERCTTRTVVHTEDRLDGYDVTYRYRGRNHHMRTNTHPGNRIALQVNVRPQRR